MSRRHSCRRNVHAKRRDAHITARRSDPKPGSASSAGGYGKVPAPPQEPRRPAKGT